MSYDAAANTGPTVLDEVVEADTSREPATFVATCRSDRHPTLEGRILAVWIGRDGVVAEVWVPCLEGLDVSEGDRLLLVMPANADEPVVVGVLDSLAPRQRDPAADGGPEIRLGADEALKVCLSDGTPLLQITAAEEGAEVRLLTEDADLDMPGKLRIRADDIELTARQGEMSLSASGDVKVAGEVVHLN